MGIKMKSSNALAAIQLLNVVPTETMQWLQDGPVETVMTAKTISFVLGDAAWSVPVSLDLLHSLHAGKLSPNQKTALQNKVVQAVNDLLNAATAQGYWPPKETPPVQSVDGPIPQADPMLSKLPPLKTDNTASPTAPATGTVQIWPEFDLTKIHKADRVDLSDATHMYQPVFGTSAGSRYFMIAAAKGVRVAVRYKGGQLSVRIAGPHLSKYQKQAEVNQFKINDGYVSLHLDVGTVMMANKTLGAILLGLGIPFETPLPQLEKTIA